MSSNNSATAQLDAPMSAATDFDQLLNTPIDFLQTHDIEAKVKELCFKDGQVVPEVPHLTQVDLKSSHHKLVQWDCMVQD